MTLLSKYFPKALKDIIGQKAIYQIVTFLKNFPRKRAALLHGPTGVGKTASIQALANEQDYELVELNASDFRNKEQIEQILKPATQQASLFGTKKIILIDEIDGLSGDADRGGVLAIIDILKESNYPIFFTANDPWIPKLRALRRYTEMIPFTPVSLTDTVAYLKKICSREGIVTDEITLKKLAASTQGDLRATVNDLQVLTENKKQLFPEDIILWGREREESIFNALQLIFKSSDVSTAFQAVDDLEEEPEMISYWLDQNIPEEYRSPKARQKAYRALSDADIFGSRIRRHQYWRFLYYIKVLQSLGVQQAKESVIPGFTRYMPPAILQSLFILAAKRKKLEGLALQMTPKLHSSARRLKQSFLPYYEFIQERNPKMAEEIDEWLAR